MEWDREEFVITNDRNEIHIDLVADLLAKTYWGHKRPREVVEKLIPNSLCFSLLGNGKQIGFARVVSDYAVFSWLSDLVINDHYRGKGLGRWFLDCILNHPEIAGTQFVLQTTHGHALYEKFGLQRGEKLMTRQPGIHPG